MNISFYFIISRGRTIRKPLSGSLTKMFSMFEFTYIYILHFQRMYFSFGLKDIVERTPKQFTQMTIGIVNIIIILMV